MILTMDSLLNLKKNKQKQTENNPSTDQYLPGMYKEENPLGTVSEERDLLQSIKWLR